MHARLPVSATAVSADGVSIFGPFEEVNGVIDVRGEDIGVVKVGTVHPSEFTVMQICTPDRRLELIRRTFTSLEQLKHEDQIFDPLAHYRWLVEGSFRRKAGTSGEFQQAYLAVRGPRPRRSAKRFSTRDHS